MSESHLDIKETNILDGLHLPTIGKHQQNSNRLSCLGLVDQVAQVLIEKILNGDIKGGSRLNEEHLKNEFGISRTPLREAFRILDKNGLVEVLPRKGVFVKSITKKDIQDNFPVRANLEGLAAALAYPNLTKTDIQQMEEALDLMRQSAQKNDFYAYTGNHKDFHEIFIHSSRNAVLISMLNTLRMHTLWHRYTFQYYQQDFEESLALHQQILDLFKSRNASLTELETLVRHHIEIAMDPFLTAMDKLENATD